MDYSCKTDPMPFLDRIPDPYNDAHRAIEGVVEHEEGLDIARSTITSALIMLESVGRDTTPEGVLGAVEDALADLLHLARTAGVDRSEMARDALVRCDDEWPDTLPRMGNQLLGAYPVANDDDLSDF